MITYKFKIVAQSLSNTADVDVDSFMVRIYENLLAEIKIDPESVTLTPADTQQFIATGFTAQGNSIETDFEWSATGGVIDSLGLFTAGNDTGSFFVTATDPITNIQGQATVIIRSTTGIRKNKNVLPTDFCLYQNYPNPFNPETTIEFSVKEKCNVQLKIFDITGREVATLVNADFEAGYYHVNFDARNMATDAYLYRIQMKDFTDV